MRWVRNRFPDWALVVIIVVAVVAIAVSLVALGISSLFNQEQEPRGFSGPDKPYIARIKVIGQISGVASRFASSDNVYHHRWTMQTIDTLMADENNKGICLWLDTPGGAVYESDELYLKLKQYKDVTGRPIYAYMRKMAASGGYYVAAACDEVYANRNAWTGSIGVSLGTLFDVSGFLDKHGVRTETITAGRNKAMGSNYEPLTDEQREVYQSLVDDAYDRFVEIVATGRGMTVKEARRLADGRIFTAGQALEAGLIDGIFGETEAEAVITGMFEESPVIFDCYYRPDPNYLSLFSVSVSGGQGILGFLLGDGISQGQGDVAAVLDLAREQEAADMPPLNYLYTG